MEPISTTVMIGTLINYLANELKNNKPIQDFFKDFSSATVNWIKPIFLKDADIPKEVLASLQKNPESAPRKKAAENAIEIALEDNPDGIEMLREAYNQIIKNSMVNEKSDHNKSSIGSNSNNNIVIQGIHSGRDTKMDINSNSNEKYNK